jgi:hypothetical protein
MAVKKILVKIVIGVVLLAGLMGLFVGYKSYKAGQDFKPYQLLAVELNNELGGGFTVSERRNCGLEGPTCPIVNMSKATKVESNDSIKSEYQLFLDKTRMSDATMVDDKGCTEFKVGLQCDITEIRDNGSLRVNFESTKKAVEISITRP